MIGLDAKELKKYIISNGLLENLLLKIGCHTITPYSNELRCGLPDDNDFSKVSVFTDENLTVRIFTKGETVYGSIYDLIMYIDNISFIDSLKKCKALLGIDNTKINIKNNIDHLQFFRKIKKKRLNKGDLKTYDISILKNYSSTPHIDLIKKDWIIDKEIIDKYHIKFDERSNRIVFPHFHYNDKSKIVGLVGRTVIDGFKSLNIPKYFPVDNYKYEKSKNLYGLSHNIDEIKKNGYVIVFEAEKSVIKADMVGYGSSVSVGSHDISIFQKKLLISLDVEIVLAFDKDVDEEHIKKLTNEFSKYRKTSYMKDKWNLLRDKDSPIDRGRKRFSFLFKHRVKL